MTTSSTTPTVGWKSTDVRPQVRIVETKDRRMLVRTHYLVVFKHIPAEEVVYAIVDRWERTGAPPEFLEAMTERVVRTYHPLYELVAKYLHQLRRKA
jgi:hypothetical protein